MKTTRRSFLAACAALFLPVAARSTPKPFTFDPDWLRKRLAAQQNEQVMTAIRRHVEPHLPRPGIHLDDAGRWMRANGMQFVQRSNRHGLSVEVNGKEIDHIV